MTLIQNNNVQSYDRDLIGDEDFQAQWSNAGRTSVCTFMDKAGRPFTIYLLVQKLSLSDADDKDAEALHRGFSELLLFGAVNDNDGLCYGLFGLYHADAVDLVTEKIIQVDKAKVNREKGIGRHLYWCGLGYCGKRGKPFQPFGRSDTVAGQMFSMALEASGSPFRPGDIA
jgi:hypothetical protein